MARGKRRLSREWKHRRERKSEFLSSVRQRLEDDIKPYFKTIDTEHRQTGRGVGFWALARMIFPAVETVANVIYRTSGKERPPVRLLRELGLEYPNLVWEMYRNTLMHNDEMASASYMGRRVKWKIGVGTGHSSNRGSGCLQIDLKKLFDDLLDFLERKEFDSGSKVSNVWVKESFRFNKRCDRATRAEVLQLGRR